LAKKSLNWSTCAGIGVIFLFIYENRLFEIKNHKSNVAYQNQNRKSLIFNFSFDLNQFLI